MPPEFCDKDHRYWPTFESLPLDQGGVGRHKCAGCAYERGFEDGKERKEDLALSLDSLPDSQAGVVRQRSPHAAYAKGYMDGVHAFYNA